MRASRIGMKFRKLPDIVLPWQLPEHGTKKMNGTRWCFTLNNYDDNEYAAIMKWECRYLVVGEEIGDSGTKHLQGFCIFKKRYRLSGVKKLNSRIHFELAKGSNQQAADYCKKDGNFKEIGVMSQQGKRTDLDCVVELIKEGKSANEIFEEHGSTYIKYHRGINDAIIRVQKPLESLQVRGIWIWGPPGTGKSHAARHFDPELYIKPQNKWWDGYNGQKTVLLDDLDTHVLGHHLKIWADKWSCTGETKGGTVPLRHELFIVTSNYSVEQLWPSDIEMQRAIARRFRIIKKTGRNDLVDFLRVI